MYHMIRVNRPCSDQVNTPYIPVESDKEAGGFSVSRPKPGPTGLNTREGRVFGAVNNMADCGPSCVVELVPMLKE